MTCAGVKTYDKLLPLIGVIIILMTVLKGFESIKVAFEGIYYIQGEDVTFV